MKKILQLDSHQLSAFQKCPHKYALSHIIGIEPQEDKLAFERGKFVATSLQLYYYWKLKGKDWNRLVPAISSRAFLRYSSWKKEKISNMDVLNTILGYFRHYEHDGWQPLAVEKGFSKILYEDPNHLFIYEGRPDLIVRSGKERVAVDHKTQSMHYDIYPFNNQAIGYCWASDSNYFVYNYLKWTKEDKYRRVPKPFEPQQIRDWKDETIEWFFQIQRAKDNQRFLKSLACQDKFGLCEFTTLCEQTNEHAQAWIIKSKYKRRKEKWRAW